MPIVAVSDLGLALIVGLATAMGAGVGGVVAGYVTVTVEKRRQKFITEQDAARERAATRAAARLVWEDIDDAQTSLNQAISRDHWGIIRLKTAAWEEHRGLLVSVLSYEEWRAVASAVLLIDLQRDVENQTHDQLVAGEAASLKERTEILAEGKTALEGHIADDPK